MSTIPLFKIAVYPTPDVKNMAVKLCTEVYRSMYASNDFKKMMNFPNDKNAPALKFLVARTLFAAYVVVHSLPKLRKDYADWKAGGGADLQKKKLIDVDLSSLNKLAADGNLPAVGLENPSVDQFVDHVASRVSFWKHYRFVHEILDDFVKTHLRAEAKMT